MKVGAAVVSCRRGGASATFEQLNKYFTISGMPVASSQYWNSIHGNNAQEAAQDAALIPQRIQQALQKPDAHHAQREHGANLFYSGQCAAQ